MRPTSLTLKNFKAIGNDPQLIELAPITLLFGPNSAGKSSILQAFIYLKEVLHNRNLDPDKTIMGGDWLDLGGFQNLVHMRDLSRDMEISVSFKIDDTSNIPMILTEHEKAMLDIIGIDRPEDFLEPIRDVQITLRIQWSPLLSSPFIQCFESYVNGDLFIRIISSADCKNVYVDKLALNHAVFNRVYCEVVDDKTLSELFFSITDSSKLSQFNRGIGDAIKSGRAFKDFSVDELEAFVDSSNADANILKKISDDLEYRTTRQAHRLHKKIKNLLADIESGSVHEPVGYLGLEGQRDALPSLENGLQLDSELWLEETSETEFGLGMSKLTCQAYINALSVGPLKLLSKWLEDFSYIGPLRDLPSRNMTKSLSPNRSGWAKGLAAWELIHRLPSSSLDEINYWMGDSCLKTGYQVELKRFREVDIYHPIFSILSNEAEMDDLIKLKGFLESIPEKTRVSLREENTNLEVMPQDIGVGISQLFPVVALSVSQRTGFIAIEQPELHVHPAIQVELADLFARYAINHNKLTLLETHSEHLILRLLRRIRQQTTDDVPPEKMGLSKGHVSVQYVEPTETGTKFRTLRIDESGDFLDEWPNGFFEERDEELFF